MKLVLALSSAVRRLWSPQVTQTVSKAVAFASALDGMAGGVEKGDPMPGTGTWDPLRLGELHGLVAGSEHAGVMLSPQWLREAEINTGAWPCSLHGRLVRATDASSGSLNGEYYEAGVNPSRRRPRLATCPTGMGQILLFIGLTEGYTFPEGAWAARDARRRRPRYRWDWAAKAPRTSRPRR